MADKNIKNGLGKRIRELRSKKGLSQSKLAETIGNNMSVSRISDYENDRRAIDINTLASFAQALGTSLDYLYYGKPPRKCSYVLPKKNDQIIRSLARLIDNEVLLMIEGNLLFCDYEDSQLKTFIKNYNCIKSGFIKNKESKLRLAEEIAIDDLNAHVSDISTDDVFTAFRNLRHNQCYQILKEKKDIT